MKGEFPVVLIEDDPMMEHQDELQTARSFPAASNLDPSNQSSVRCVNDRLARPQTLPDESPSTTCDSSSLSVSTPERVRLGGSRLPGFGQPPPGIAQAPSKPLPPPPPPPPSGCRTSTSETAKVSSFFSILFFSFFFFSSSSWMKWLSRSARTWSSCVVDKRVVHASMILDHVVMASLLVVQRHVPIALVVVDLELLVEQPFEGTHLDVGSDCLPHSTCCAENSGWRATCRRLSHLRRGCLE